MDKSCSCIHWKVFPDASNVVLAIESSTIFVMCAAIVSWLSKLASKFLGFVVIKHKFVWGYPLLLSYCLILTKSTAWTFGRWQPTMSKILLEYMLNKRGPRRDPWGTPQREWNKFESAPWTDISFKSQIFILTR